MFFTLQMSKILTAFACSLGFLLTDPAISQGCQISYLLFTSCGKEHRVLQSETLTLFFCATKVIWIKYFSPSFTKHVPILELLALEYTLVVGNL